MKLQKLIGIAFGLCLGGTLYASAQTQLTDYVDPRIGRKDWDGYLSDRLVLTEWSNLRPTALLHPIAAGYPCPNGWTDSRKYT